MHKTSTHREQRAIADLVFEASRHRGSEAASRSRAGLTSGRRVWPLTRGPRGARKQRARAVIDAAPHAIVPHH